MPGAENDRVENTLKVLGVRVTASVDASALILVGIGNSNPPGAPEEGREHDDGGETDDGGGKQAEGAPPPPKGAPS